MKRIKESITVILLICLTFSLSACNSKNESLYADTANWAYYESEESNKTADVFFACPTVYGGDENSFNMAMDDTEKRGLKFAGGESDRNDRSIQIS